MSERKVSKILTTAQVAAQLEKKLDAVMKKPSKTTASADVSGANAEDNDWDRASTTSEVESKALTKLGGVPGQGRRLRGNRRNGGMSLPPMMNLTTTFRFRMMYQNTGSSFTAVSLQNLAMAPGSVCTVTNSTLTGIVGSFRIRRLTIWPSAATSTPDEAYVVWSTSASSRAKDEQKLKVLPDGITNTGAMVFKPPRGSLAWDWLASSSTGTIFNISCAAGSVVLLDMTCTLCNNFSGATQTVATGTLGQFYYPYMDGPTTHRYAPLAVTSTF